MKRMSKYFIILVLLGLFGACHSQQDGKSSPWSIAGADTASASRQFSFDDIVSNGELIVLTISGPGTYYDYRGQGAGFQYLLCESFAQQIGVKLRVELCRDTAELVRRLVLGDGDVIMFPLHRQSGNSEGLIYCGPSVDSTQTSWAVSSGNLALADTLNRWFSPALIAQVQELERRQHSGPSVRRRVYAPMLDKSGGVISKYDAYFKKYAPVARLDWRLLAAQCYQESCFDPNAVSWAGARGLMQIMPATASHLGVDVSQLHDPETNIEAAARYMRELLGLFKDVARPIERLHFALASYNGGFHHIRDAMALAKKDGKSPHLWQEVSPYVLRLSSAEYYTDPVVRHGYMRGSETVDYVERIRARWRQYGGAAGGVGGKINSSPVRATKKHRFK